MLASDAITRLLDAYKPVGAYAALLGAATQQIAGLRVIQEHPHQAILQQVALAEAAQKREASITHATEIVHRVLAKYESKVMDEIHRNKGRSPLLQLFIEMFNKRFCELESPSWLKEASHLSRQLEQAYVQPSRRGRHANIQTEAEQLSDDLKAFFLYDLLFYIRHEEDHLVSGDSDQIIANLLKYSVSAVEKRRQRVKNIAVLPVTNEDYWVFGVPLDALLVEVGYQDVINQPI